MDEFKLSSVLCCLSPLHCLQLYSQFDKGGVSYSKLEDENNQTASYACVPLGKDEPTQHSFGTSRKGISQQGWVSEFHPRALHGGR